MSLGYPFSIDSVLWHMKFSLQVVMTISLNKHLRFSFVSTLLKLFSINIKNIFLYTFLKSLH